MKTLVLACLTCVISVALSACESSQQTTAMSTSAAAAAVEVAGFSFTPDQRWTEQTPSSSMRSAQYSVGPETSLIVYYFGPGTAGSIDANLDRWCGQFEQIDGRDSKDAAQINRSRINGMTVHTLDLGGTFVAETRPGSGVRVNEPAFHMLAAIIETTAGPYYIKFVGPAGTVQQWRSSYMTMLASVQPNDIAAADSGAAHP